MQVEFGVIHLGLDRVHDLLVQSLVKLPIRDFSFVLVVHVCSISAVISPYLLRMAHWIRCNYGLFRFQRAETLRQTYEKDACYSDL